MTIAKQTGRDPGGRRRLLRRATARSAKSRPPVRHLRREGSQQLVHKLQVHQAELETQNEELRRVQLDLEASRDRFARLYDLAPVGYLTLDAEGVIHEANLAAAGLLGIEREALPGKNLASFVAPESQDDLYRHRQRAFTSSSLQTCDLQIRRSGAAALVARLQSLREPADPGQPARCLVALSDVTRVLRTEALLQSEAIYRSLFELNPCPMWICDEHSLAFLDVNESALRLYGWSRESFLQQTARDIRRPEELMEFLHTVNPPGNSPAPFAGERRHLKGDGSVFDAAVSLASISYAGRPALLGLVHDITERKRLEREILDISEREQQRTGHELHDGLGQQLHGLSYLAVLLEKGLLEAGSPHAAEAGQLNRYLAEALEMTRNLARGLQPVTYLPEGLMTALRELTDRTRELYRVDCRFVCVAPVLIPSHSAANHLYRIAQEAVHNAMKHAAPTRLRVRLAATGQKITLSVRDNGAGFPPQRGPGRGMGLRVMQYRANAIGAALLIRESARGGTEVVCTIAREALLPPEDKLK